MATLLFSDLLWSHSSLLSYNVVATHGRYVMDTLLQAIIDITMARDTITMQKFY